MMETSMSLYNMNLGTKFILLLSCLLPRLSITAEILRRMSPAVLGVSRAQELEVLHHLKLPAVHTIFHLAMA